MTAKNRPTINLLPIDTVIQSHYEMTEPFGIQWEKHLVRREASYGTSYYVVSKLGDERQQIHKSYKRVFAATVYYVELELM